MICLSTLQAPIRGRPLLLYLASNSQAIRALLVQEDDDGNEQPIYYVRKTLKMLKPGIRTLRAVKSQAIADLLSQFPGSEECSLIEEILGEVAVIELLGKKWTMRFDGLAMAISDGLGIVLSCDDGDTLPLYFKLGFSCSNNAVEYEAYLTGLTIALAIGVKHMRVLGDSNLVIS
ncbi:uncharacterized protein LOC142625149 [Castanea sativa]|uniref:uncharacterized protein LOC142625149 n=1 Tax=Castanea sativa TaxID=21020 RepID=UPI003F64C095